MGNVHETGQMVRALGTFGLPVASSQFLGVGLTHAARDLLAPQHRLQVDRAQTPVEAPATSVR